MHCEYTLHVYLPIEFSYLYKPEDCKWRSRTWVYKWLWTVIHRGWERNFLPIWDQQHYFKRNSIQYILITHSFSPITDVHLSIRLDSSLFCVTLNIWVITYISPIRPLLSQSIKMFKLKVLFLCILTPHWLGFSANKCFTITKRRILKQLVLSTVTLSLDSILRVGWNKVQVPNAWAKDKFQTADQSLL